MVCWHEADRRTDRQTDIGLVLRLLGVRGFSGLAGREGGARRWRGPIGIGACELSPPGH